jgi:hypothetical protein
MQHRRRREQLELEVVGQLQLAADLLLAEIALDQPRVLHRRPDLVRDGGDQLAVAGSEAIAADPVGEIDDADASEGGVRRAVADRHAQVGAAAVAAITAAVARRVLRFGGVVDDGTLFAVHLRGHGAVVVHRHRR